MYVQLRDRDPVWLNAPGPTFTAWNDAMRRLLPGSTKRVDALEGDDYPNRVYLDCGYVVHGDEAIPLHLLEENR